MSNSSRKRSGYVLVSVTVVLLTVLAAILAVNKSYVSKIHIDRETNSLGREEIELSAFAHLKAYAEQKNCTATPNNMTVSGTKDGYDYSMNWSKSPSGSTLSGNFQLSNNSGSSWSTEQTNIEMYGETQSVTWVLASYFSEYVEIKHNNASRHHDHSHHAEAKIQADKEIVLRSFKLGPLRTEPLKIVHAELELSFDNINDFRNPELIQLNAIRYPWDTATATDQSTGFGPNSNWTLGSYDKFHPLDTDLTLLTNSARIDFTSLLASWQNGTRPNYGWALTTTGTQDTKWVSSPSGGTFEQRPRMHIKYRCACGEACVGVDQTEALALGTLNPVDGYGGGNEKMIKLWLHRAHQQYLIEDPSSGEVLDRTVYYPAGLSDFDVPNTTSGHQITGAHIELANADHPDHHYYTLMDGQGINNTSLFPLPSAHDKQLTYYQSAADKPIGDSSMQLRKMPTPTSGNVAAPQPVSTYVTDSSAYAGGYSYFDDRYWFGTQLDGEIKTQDFPVKDDTASATSVHTADTSRSILAVPNLNFDAYHTIDALHVINRYNYLLSGEWFNTTDYESALGRRQFHDGDIVLYNTITKTARVIDGEISRSDHNNVSAISLFKEPMPPSGSTESEFEDAFPFLY